MILGFPGAFRTFSFGECCARLPGGYGARNSLESRPNLFSHYSLSCCMKLLTFLYFQAVIPSRSMERTDLTHFCHYPLTSLFLQFDDDIIMRALIPGELGGNQVLDLRFSQSAASKSGGHTVLTMEKVIILVVSHTVNMDFVFCQ